MELKTIVIYKSKSGYTKTYAEWIAEELKCELVESTNISLETLLEYDTIVFGGGLYAIGINGISIITKNFEALKDKNIIVWATGSSPGRENEIKEVWKHNFSEEQRGVIKTFYLRGGFDYNKLSRGDKLLMGMLKMKLRSKGERNEDEEGLLKAYDIPEYHCSKDKAQVVLEYVLSL